MPRTEPAHIREEFAFLASIIGVPAAVFRLSAAYGVTTQHVLKVLHRAGHVAYLDRRELAE